MVHSPSRIVTEHDDGHLSAEQSSSGAGEHNSIHKPEGLCLSMHTTQAYIGQQTHSM